MCREGRRHPGGNPVMGREQSSSQLNSLCQETPGQRSLRFQPGIEAVTFFLPLPFSLCLRMLLVGTCRCPAPGMLGALPSDWISSQNGSAVFCSGQAFRDHKPGMVEMSIK